MKIALITIIDNTNYGTYLQALALYRVLSNENEVLLVNYHRSKSLPINSLKQRYYSQAKKVSIWDLISQLLLIPLKKFLMRKEISKYVVLSKKLTNSNFKNGSSLDADIFCTGSDQVWNTDYNEGIDEVFYLNFANNKKKKISYAASIGQDIIEDSYKERIYQLLSQYDKITLRERKSIKLLSDLGLNNIEFVLDPTLLLSKDDWNALLNLKKTTEKYILVYSVEANKTSSLLQLAKKISIKSKQKIYLIENGNPFKHRSIEVDKTFYSPSISKFVELFYNASFIIASSFHGTAFSINFNKQFLVVLPDKFNIRINSLLEEFSIQDHGIYSNEIESIVDSYKKIDYSIVNNLLLQEKQRSLAILRNMINN